MAGPRSVRRRCSRWPLRAKAVHAVVRAGYTDYPAGVKRVCLALASRGWDNPGALTQERLGDHSKSYGTLGTELADSELRRLATYRART